MRLKTWFLIFLAFGIFYGGYRFSNLIHHTPASKKPISTSDKTVAIIKPGAVAAHNTGNIIHMIEQHGFTIVALKKITFTQQQAQKFYAAHKDRPFFNDLITSMTSGPSIVMILQKDKVIPAWRDVMGATDPKKANPETIRALFGTDVTNNAVHGSDWPESAAIEIHQLFPELS